MEPILWDAELQTGPANCRGCLCICTKEHTGICNLPTREKRNASWARIANAMKDTKLSPRMVRWSKFEEDDAWICPSHSPPAAPNRAVGEAHSRYVHSQRHWDFVVPSAPALYPSSWCDICGRYYSDSRRLHLAQHSLDTYTLVKTVTPTTTSKRTWYLMPAYCIGLAETSSWCPLVLHSRHMETHCHPPCAFSGTRCLQD